MKDRERKRRKRRFKRFLKLTKNELCQIKNALKIAFHIINEKKVKTEKAEAKEFRMYTCKNPECEIVLNTGKPFKWNDNKSINVCSI